MGLILLNVLEVIILFAIIGYSAVVLKQHADNMKFRKGIKQLSRETMIGKLRYELEFEAEKADIDLTRNIKKVWNIEEDVLPEELINQVEIMQKKENKF